MNEKTLGFLKQKKVTFFVGAGVSMIPPSCLPSWWQINHTILDALTGEAQSLVPDIGKLTNLIKKREEEGKLPPEFVAETITNRIGSSYFEVLQGLEGDTPNGVHLWLATLAKAGMVRSIVTTNFDTLLERAFKKVGADLQVWVDPKDYGKMGFEGDKRDEPCILLKLHGTASRPETCIDTLAQRKRGLHPLVTKAINQLGLQTFWVFLGYSGADLEADPNYLGLRGRAGKSPGFAWLHLPEGKARPVVSSLADLYGPEGIIEAGTLPGWMDPLKEILPPGINPPEDFSFSPEEAARVREFRAGQIGLHAHNWARERDLAVCAIVLSDIGTTGGYYQESRNTLMEILKAADEGSLTPFGLGILYQELGDLRQHFGESTEAFACYQKAIHHYREADNPEGLLHSLQGSASIQQHLGYYDQAEKTLQECLQYIKKKGDPENYIHALLDMGSFYQEIGQIKKGLTYLEEALPLATEQGLELLRAHTLLGMAMIHESLGDLSQAKRLIKESNGIYSRLGDDRFLSESLRHLARTYFKRGQINKAFELLEQARQKAEQVGHKSRTLQAEQVKGEFLLQLGHYADGEAILSRVAEEVEKLGDQEFLITVWQNLGLALQMQGKVEKAFTLYQKALSKTNEMELEVKGAGLRLNLGILIEQQEKLEEALDHYLAADKIFRRAGLLSERASSQGNIANIYYRFGNFEESQKYYQKTLEIFEKLQNLDGLLRTRYNLANVIYQTGDIERAKSYYEESIHLADQYGQEGLRDLFRLNYATILFKGEDYSSAIELYSSTCESMREKRDYLQAGKSAYYAGLCYVRQKEAQQAIQSIEKALSIWQNLDYPPSLAEEARRVLESLNRGV